MLVPESSPEKMRGADLFRTLLLCCFFGEKARPVLATSFCTSHTATAFTSDTRSTMLFSALQRHRAWDIRSQHPLFSKNGCPK